MTRMTSDVESLQQLLQDGFAQFAIQALTMVVVTAVLFHYNAELALITLLLVVPAADWSRRCGSGTPPTAATTASATPSPAMFADLSESLNGVRVVTAHNRQDRNIVGAPRGGRRLPRRQRLHRPDQRDLRPRHRR